MGPLQPSSSGKIIVQSLGSLFANRKAHPVRLLAERSERGRVVQKSHSNMPTSCCHENAAFSHWLMRHPEQPYKLACSELNELTASWFQRQKSLFSIYTSSGVLSWMLAGLFSQMTDVPF